MHMAATTKVWTLEELHSLPDDGNKYELIDGELFVTPAPTDAHETIGARLTRRLDPYVAANRLGLVYHPRAVVRRGRSEVEPDLMVRAEKTPGTTDWTDAPLPVLVVEILSPTTRRRDLSRKRAFYLNIGVAEYWIVDPEARTITSVVKGRPDVVASVELQWTPPGVRTALAVDVAAVFSEAGRDRERP
jgi:Uma2 family endonuclease